MRAEKRNAVLSQKKTNNFWLRSKLRSTKNHFLNRTMKEDRDARKFCEEKSLTLLHFCCAYFCDPERDGLFYFHRAN